MLVCEALVIAETGMLNSPESGQKQEWPQKKQQLEQPVQQFWSVTCPLQCIVIIKAQHLTPKPELPKAGVEAGVPKAGVDGCPKA